MADALLARASTAARQSGSSTSLPTPCFTMPSTTIAPTVSPAPTVSTTWIFAAGTSTTTRSLSSLSLPRVTLMSPSAPLVMTTSWVLGDAWSHALATSRREVFGYNHSTSSSLHGQASMCRYMHGMHAPMHACRHASECKRLMMHAARKAEQRQYTTANNMFRPYYPPMHTYIHTDRHAYIHAYIHCAHPHLCHLTMLSPCSHLALMTAEIAPNFSTALRYSALSSTTDGRTFGSNTTGTPCLAAFLAQS